MPFKAFDVFSLDSVQIQAVTTLAWRHLCAGRADEARALFAWLVKLMPARGELRLALAHALLGCGRPDEALSELEVLVSSREPAAHFLYGKALVQTGRLADARLAFERYREYRLAPASSYRSP